MSTESCDRHEIESIHSNLLADVSEEEQESLSGGFVFMYFNQREIFTDASNTTNYSGSVTPGGGSGGSTVSGNFNGSSNSSYYLKETTFMYSDSSSSFVGLPRLLGWLSSMRF
jgi:hypothetical protein